MRQNTIYKMLNTSYGADHTIGDDVFDIYMEGRDVSHGPIVHRDFSKKKFSMFDSLIRTLEIAPVCDKKAGTEILKATHIFNYDESICYNIAEIRDSSDKRAEEILKAWYNIPLDEHMLGLPFHNTCIVTPDCACVLYAVKGKEHAYMFIMLNKMHGMDDMQFMSSGIVICPEKITIVDELKVAVNSLYVRKPSGKFVLFHGKDRKADGAMMAPLLGRVMAFIMQLNTPDRFIMEVKPTNSGVKSAKYIPRSHQRAEYILLHPNVIRHYMKTESDVEGHKKRGHERRGHLRRYPDDPIKFPKAHGRVIQIPPLWIGRTEATVGDRQYKVIL